MDPNASKKLHNSHNLALILVSSSPLSEISCSSSLGNMLMRMRERVATMPGQAYFAGVLLAPSTNDCFTTASAQLHHPILHENHTLLYLFYRPNNTTTTVVMMSYRNRRVHQRQVHPIFLLFPPPPPCQNHTQNSPSMHS
jgi:hypothetical protein